MANPILYAIHHEFESRYRKERSPIERLQAVMTQAARQSTAEPAAQADWSPLDPFAGHGMVAALVVQDLFAGDLAIFHDRNAKDQARSRMGNLVHLNGRHQPAVAVIDGMVSDLQHVELVNSREALLASKFSQNSRLAQRYEAFAGQCHVTMAMLLF